MKKWYAEADLVIWHGTIYTVAIPCDEIRTGRDDFPIIHDGGIAVKDGRIIAVGTSADVQPFIGEHTEVIDATGKVIAPGFCESHLHCFFYGVSLMKINLQGIAERQKVLDLVAEEATKRSAGKWIEGNGWNNLIWDDTRLITRKELDAVAPEHPVFLISTTYHTACANSVALKLAGITRDLPDPEGGTIGREADGTPNGLLYENSALNLIQRIIPKATEDENVKAIRLAGEKMAELGIASIIDANMADDQVRAYKTALERGELKYRANLMYYLDSARGGKEYHLRRLEEAVAVTGFGNEMLKFNGIKVTLDGVPATFTAALRKPYKLNPNTCGSSIWTQEEITVFVCKANELGWQFGIHTIGDRAVDMALEAFETANAQKPLADRRDYLIHYVMPQEDHWPKMKAMNINVTMQPTIVSELDEAPALFEKQARWNQGAGLMFKSGILCGGSSDCPVVSPDPIKGMYYAVTRLDITTGEILGEECRVTPRQALIMWTKNSAYLSHDDDKMGSVEVGNFADLLLINHEFLTDDPEDIKNAKVERTILGGQTVYTAAE